MPVDKYSLDRYTFSPVLEGSGRLRAAPELGRSASLGRVTA